jgi:type IV pilus assembly protein PilB
MIWRLGEILIQKKWIAWKQLEEALEAQKQEKELLGEILVRKGYLSRKLLYLALAERSGLRFVDPRHVRINPKAVDLIPRSIAEKYSLLPIEIQRGILYVGVADPLAKWPEEDLKQMAKVQEVRMVLCLPEDIRQMIQEEYNAESLSRE